MVQGFGTEVLLFILCLWISVSGVTKVEAYFNDGLNPIKSGVDVWHQRITRVAVKTNDDLQCEKPSLYICEEPPETISPESTKQCNYRNINYHEQVYRWVAGRGCLLYTPDFLFAAGSNTINLNAGCVYGNMFAPCLEIAKADGTCGCYPFDPSLEEVAVAVREALVTAAHGRWESCFYEAAQCCSHHMGQDTDGNFSGCTATFDGWTCWDNADADTVNVNVCSEFAYSNVGPSCDHFSSKTCDVNGTWELQTDYSTCSVTPRLLLRYRFYIAVLAFSIASCLPAIFVFFFYKRLRVPRVALHRNLLIAIIVRNVLVIVSRSEIYIDELTNSEDTVMATHSIACRILAVAERITANAVFVCMMVEGIYLHRLIVAVFKKKLNLNMLYGIGAAIAVVPVVAWAAVMGVHDDHSCWLVYTVENIQWIIDAPRVAVLLVNTGLFLDVLRVLLTKIRNNENTNQLSTTKATLFLMPLFGTQFLLTALRPSTADCTWEQVYYFATYTVEGLQGFIVAVMYCYANREVHTLIKATYKKTENAVVSRVRRDSNYRRTTLGFSKSDRRMTYSTGLDPHHEEDKPNTAVSPKLNVAEIISIQASERLADLLEPVYEMVENGERGVPNDGYDSLERSDLDNDSGFIPHRNSKVDDYYGYGFTNASSVSIECQDWIRCVSSPSSSVYNNSLNDYEVKYLERKFQNQGRCEDCHQRHSGLNRDSIAREILQENELEASEHEITEKENNEEYDISDVIPDSEIENEDDMIVEIMQCLDDKDNIREVMLDPSVLSPNRGDDDKIVFVE